MIMEADAVANPWAVVIHFKDAFFALSAVVASLRLNKLGKNTNHKL
jgi:hypothetical protein